MTDAARSQAEQFDALALQARHLVSEARVHSGGVGVVQTVLGWNCRWRDTTWWVGERVQEVAIRGVAGRAVRVVGIA